MSTLKKTCATLASVRFPVTLGLFLSAWIVFFDSNLRSVCQLNWAGGLEETHCWQFMACHFTHWSTEQLFWDSLAFLSLGIICESRDRISFAATIGLSCVTVAISAIVFSSDISSYRGLSGVDSAIFVLAAIGVIRDSWATNRSLAVFGIMGLFAFLTKMAYEFNFGSTLFVHDESFRPMPVAHLVGAITAIVVFLIQVVAIRMKTTFRSIGTAGQLIRCDRKNPNVPC